LWKSGEKEVEQLP
jgi:hypothetical protein